MGLTGVDPNSPRPANLREIILGAGPSNTSGKSRDVLIFGNKTSAGSETVDVISTPVLDDADAIARFGRRSEWYASYKKYVAIDPAATIYGVAPTESGGTAASCTFTFATSATDTTSVEVAFQGETVQASVSSGDTAIAVATAVVSAINNAAEGTWQATAANGGTAVVTVTASQKGPRGDLLLGSTSSTGMRMRFLKNVTMTVTKSALTAGTTEDDFTAAYTAASAGEYFYQVSPKHSTSAVTATDNGVGEHINMVKTQALPVNGKEQVAIFGFVGTQAQATTVATSSGANSEWARFFAQKNSDWSPGMIAAHHAAIMRSKEIAHPSANINGYSSANGIYLMPDCYTKTDRWTTTEIDALLNSGVCPIASSARGTPYLVRHVTSRSVNAQGQNDYRAREGHITSAIAFAWQTMRARWDSQKQPFLADDPVKGAKPLPQVSTPSQLKALIFTLIDDLTSANPLGQYEGPIFNPSPAAVAQMKNAVAVTHSTGALNAWVEWLAVEHNIKTSTLIRETSPAY